MLINIEVKPLSINRAWRGRRFKTPEYTQFEKDCSWYLRNKKMIKGEVEIDYKFLLKNYKMTDVDNCIKTVTDQIVKAGIIEDDRKIVKLMAQKFETDEDMIVIEIKPYVNTIRSGTQTT